MVKNPATIAETPAASPSSPSSQLTVLIIPMNQKIVSAATTGHGNTIWLGLNGLLTRSMKIMKARAISAERNWAIYWGRLANS